MSGPRSFFVSLAAAALLWLAFSWPLPRYFSTGIPLSSDNVEGFAARRMVPGDHLQFLYHLWLVSDMYLGHTPWFHNPYEFNTGDDGDSFYPSTHYFPFGLVFMLFSQGFGWAAGWNLTGLVSLWLTLWATWALIRRYGVEAGPALAAAALSIALPYRWINLLGGSPTGLAMMWVPILWIGVDALVRRPRWRTAFAVGAGYLMCCWGDSHVFFFCVLAIPFWILLAWLSEPGRVPRRLSDVVRQLPFALPVALFIVTGYAHRTYLNKHIAGDVIRAGREWIELARYSPRWPGFIDPSSSGLYSHVYVGFLVVVLVGLGLAASTLPARGSTAGSTRNRWILLLLMLAAGAVALLALGAQGPWHGLPVRIARKCVPGYHIIRQPAKIFCLVPTLLSLSLALALLEIGRRIPGRTWSRRLAILLPLFVLIGYAARSNPHICLLDPEQPAYRTLADKARGQGRDPRALILPLWPGDSHWTSIYEYYASLYRIRMVNGYRPYVKTSYREEVFRALRSANHGFLDDEQIDLLRRMRVEFIVLHEDAYPEKIGPFPVGVALTRLLEHPRLELLTRSESVWVFEILDQPRRRPPPPVPPVVFATCARWEPEQLRTVTGRTTRDPRCSGNGYLELSADGHHLSLPASHTGPTPDLRYLFRLRGRGALEIETRFDDEPAARRQLDIDADDWTWIAAPLGPLTHYQRFLARLRWISGRVDLDTVLLTAGGWPDWAPGESLRIPAQALFRGGYSNPQDGSVRLRRDADPDQVVLYGPGLPLPAGTYDIALRGRPLAPASGAWGRFRVRTAIEESPWQVLEGEVLDSVVFAPAENLPLRCEFEFARRADVEISEIVITRRR
jgi:hypothetical protein